MPARPSLPAPSHFPAHHHLRCKVHTHHPPTPRNDPARCANKGRAAGAEARPLQPLHGELSSACLAGGHAAAIGARTHPSLWETDRRYARVRQAAAGPGPRAETVHGDGHRSLSPLVRQEGSDQVRSRPPAEPPALDTADGSSYSRVCSGLLVVPDQTGSQT